MRRKFSPSAEPCVVGEDDHENLSASPATFRSQLHTASVARDEMRRLFEVENEDWQELRKIG